VITQGIGVEQAKQVQVQNQVPLVDQNKNIGGLAVSTNNEGLNRAENAAKEKEHAKTSESNIEINQLKNNSPLSIEEANAVAEMNTKSAKAVDYTVCAKTMTAIGAAISTLGTLIFGVIYLSRDKNESHTATVEDKRLEACKEGVKRFGEAIIKSMNDSALILKAESDITKNITQCIDEFEKKTDPDNTAALDNLVLALSLVCAIATLCLTVYAFRVGGKASKIEPTKADHIKLQGEVLEAAFAKGITYGRLKVTKENKPEIFEVAVKALNKASGIENTEENKQSINKLIEQGAAREITSAPVPASTPALASVPVPASTPASVPTQGSTPASAPVPASTPASVPTQGSTPASASVPTQGSTPASAPVPASTPAPITTNEHIEQATESMINLIEDINSRENISFTSNTNSSNNSMNQTKMTSTSSKS